MKRYLLSFLVIATSGAWVWYARTSLEPTNAFSEATIAAPDAGRVLSLPAAQLSVLKGPAVAVPNPAKPAPAIQPLPLPTAANDTPAADVQPLPRPATPASDHAPASAMPLPRIRPEPISVPAAAATSATTNGRYRDGTWSGPTVDAYYGTVQVRANVQNGAVVSIDVLRFPSDRRTSARINRYALPVLQDEVIAAQSARVDIVSGATLTSRAYRRSLDAALTAART